MGMLAYLIVAIIERLLAPWLPHTEGH